MAGQALRRHGACEVRSRILLVPWRDIPLSPFGVVGDGRLEEVTADLREIPKRVCTGTHHVLKRHRRGFVFARPGLDNAVLAIPNSESSLGERVVEGGLRLRTGYGEGVRHRRVGESGGF